MTGTLIIISSVHWHFTWQRHHDIAVGFAKLGYKVIFIEPIPKRWPSIREIKRVLGRVFKSKLGGGNFLQEIPPGIEIISPILLPDTNAVTSLFNIHFLLPRLVKRIIPTISRKPSYLINYLPIPTSLELQKKLMPDVSAYDCVWDWANDPFAPRMRLRETEMIHSSDIVFADSPYLVNKMESHHKSTYQVLPAVQYNLYEEMRVDYKPSGRQKPVLGYFGSLKVNIDLDLLHETSQEYKLIIIGPEPPDTIGFSPTTEFLGPVPHQELPLRIKEADVLLLPYKHAPHTQAVIPAKTFECLATGLPVIVTGLESLDEFSDYFYICKDKNNFKAHIEIAYHETPGNREARLKFAKENDWSVRLKQIERHFQECKNSLNDSG